MAVPPRAIMVTAPDYARDLIDRAGFSLDEGSRIYADTEALKALTAITKYRPGLVVIERFFASTPRGAALINRIKSDPTLRGTEIRVLAHDSDYSRVVPRPVLAPSAAEPVSAAPVAAAATAAPAAPPLDYRGTRRAPRFQMRSGMELQLDGHPTAVLDLSRIGAQVVSTSSLRPNVRMRAVLSDDTGPMRFGVTVMWAKFEVTPDGPRYRAGLEFSGAESRPV